MKFWKMQGAGNDYIYVNCFEENVQNPSATARKVSNRHYGIGGDGLILIKPSHKADFTMEMYNADGSQGEMCGNAIRCVGKYVYELNMTSKTSIAIETLAGIKVVNLNVQNGKVDLVTVDMGAPILNPKEIPVLSDEKDFIKKEIEVDGNQYEVTCLSMGNPHCVVFMDAIDTLPIEKIGPLFEHHALFPNRINTEFVQIIDRNNIKMRVWERGSGETLACGTGTCAAVVASVLNGKTDLSVNVSLLGGNLFIQWDRDANTVFMTGGAEFVFCGEIE